MTIGSHVKVAPGVLSGRYAFRLQNSVGTVVAGPHIRYSYYSVVFSSGLVYNFTQDELVEVA